MSTNNIESNSKAIPKELIQALKSRLPKGGMAKIAEDLDLSHTYVWRVFKEGKPIKKVIYKAIEIIKEEEKELKEIKETLKTI